MQMCGNCMRVYDESEYSKCPYCHPKKYAGLAKLIKKKDVKK